MGLTRFFSSSSPRSGNGNSALRGALCRDSFYPAEIHYMQSPIGESLQLELALLRRSLGDIAGKVEHCDDCHRALLIGERVYEYDNGELQLPALCRDGERDTPAHTRTVHTAAHGHSIRILDRRPVKRAA